MKDLSHLKRQLTRYKDLLANLSRRNRELYYREAKGSSINLSKQAFPQSTYIEGTKQNFTPLKFASLQYSKLLKGEEFNLSKHFSTDDIAEGDALRRLQRKIDQIRLNDERHQREFGISSAWILGPFLCWRISGQSAREDLLITPVFKIPIDIERNKKRQFIVKAEEEVALFNPSLRLYLKQLFGIELPEVSEIEDTNELIKFLNSELSKVDRHILPVSTDLDGIPKFPSRYKIVKDEHGEIIERRPVLLEEVLSPQDLEIYKRVTSTEFLLIDVLYLDLLNANRMVLIHDYDGIIETGIDHPILNELFNGTPIAEDPPFDRSKLKELDAYVERDNHFVVDIDGTQHRAIDEAIKSRAIVIQGPPGSGKSQTIVNLIADYLAKGKKVLFVSEKRPALDIVFDRMKSANIDSQAVLIHSSDLNKSDLYSSFLELANSTPNSTDDREWESASNSLDHVKSELNGYANTLQEQHTISQLSFVDILILGSKTQRNLYNQKVYNYFGAFTYETINKIASDLNEIQTIFNSHPKIRTSPWNSRRSNTIRSLHLEHSLEALKSTLNKHASEKLKIENKMRELIGLEPTPENLEFLEQINAPSKVPTDYSPLWTNLKDVLPKIEERLQDIINRLNSNREFFQSIASTATPEIIDELEKYYQQHRGILSWFSGKFWRNRRKRQAICINWDGTNKQFVGCKEYNVAFKDAIQCSNSFYSKSNFTTQNHDEHVEWLGDQAAFLVV